VDALHERLSDLEAAAPAARPAPEALARYRSAAAALSERLRPLAAPAFARGAAPRDKLPAPLSAGASGLGAPSSSSAASAAAASRPLDLRSLAAAGAAPPPAAAAAAAGGRDALKLSDAARAGLAAQRGLQDDLAGEVAALVGGLRDGTLAMQSALRRRGAALDAAEGSLTDSLGGARAAAAGARKAASAGRAGFCATCLVLLAVGAVFALMVVFIKVTSMVGLG